MYSNENKIQNPIINQPSRFNFISILLTSFGKKRQNKNKTIIVVFKLPN